MAQERAKLLAELERYMEKHAAQATSPEAVEHLVSAFMAGGFSEKKDTADEALSRARQAASDCEDLRVRLTESALEEEKRLREAGYYTDAYAGRFWVTAETRGYIRLEKARMEALAACGMLRASAKLGESLLPLCEDDGPGIRFILMIVYAMLEEPEPMLRLHETYESYEETGMLLPLSMVFYRTGDLSRAADYLLRLAAVNPGTEEFVCMIRNSEVPQGSGRPFTLGELAGIYNDYPGLFRSSAGWIPWADRTLGAGLSERV